MSIKWCFCSWLCLYLYITASYADNNIIGIRLENVYMDDKHAENGVRYDKQHVSIVLPNVLLNLVIFGQHLNNIDSVGLTSSNCQNLSFSFHRKHIKEIKKTKIEVQLEFKEPDVVYKICVKEFDSNFVLYNEPELTISTFLPLQNYYFKYLWLEILIITILLAISGLFSGLNLGLMTLTPQELLLISKSGSDQEKKYAEIILPIRKSGNQLLCSLLFGNVIVNSSISILFDDLTSGYVALIFSSLGIVVFGEIFPQALCVQKGLSVGAHTIWITRFFMVLTFPLAYPVSKLLDYIFTVEVVSYDRKRLMELIRMTSRNEGAEELKIAIGAMEIFDKTVADVMTKIDDVFMLSENTIINTEMINEILKMGYTRIPVYREDRNNVVSLLFVKDLALMDPDDNLTVKTVCGNHVLRTVPRNTLLGEMLKEFKKGDYHLALVKEVGKEVLVGIVTLEDIVEEILQEEIVDETDFIIDNVKRTRRKRALDITNFLSNYHASKCLISMQMQLVTIQWLRTNFPPFKTDFISPSILESIIRTNVHKVKIFVDEVNDLQKINQNPKLYVKNQPSDKFILILEGRAFVHIGMFNLIFEARSWSYFGNELLFRLLKVLTQESSKKTRKASKNKTVIAVDNSSNTTIALQNECEARNITFTPDFTLEIRDNCTYLEISVRDYIKCFKRTLSNRIDPMDNCPQKSKSKLGNNTISNK